MEDNQQRGITLKISEEEFNDQFSSVLIDDSSWSNLSKIIFRRTYLRQKDNDITETFKEALKRVIRGNVHRVGWEGLDSREIERLTYFLGNRKAGPAGRGWWFSGTDAHARIGAGALVNCWFLNADSHEKFVDAMNFLMLGGGVGMSVERHNVYKLPKIKENVTIKNKETKDADFIVPDSREGWCDLIRRVFDSYFVTGKSFSYSTICVRKYGEKINGFGGVAGGAGPLVFCVEQIGDILKKKEGQFIGSLDASDLLCCIGEMVVSGNLRRSALLLLGDCSDKEFLKAKRWDLGPIPNYRSTANFSIMCENVEDLHPLFWESYEHGEPFGIFNRKNAQDFGRMIDPIKDIKEEAHGLNPCGEAILSSKECCNLTEIFLPNLKDEDEFIEAARLMMRWGKRVTLERYPNEETQKIVERTRRVGIGITGCLQSGLFNPKTLEKAYKAVLEEDAEYSSRLGIPESIRHCACKPSGTLSLWGDCTAGIHPGWGRYEIRRVRFGANDSLIPVLRAAGHPIEYEKKFDGSFSERTVVVDFYRTWPDLTPVVNEGFDTWEQLDVLLMAQRYWADQSVSVTVYYKKEEIPKIKEWLREHLKDIKTISFLPYNDHGFEQAPLEAITKEQYEQATAKIKPIELDRIDDGDLESMECHGGACPIK